MNIDFLNAGCADAVHINFIGNDEKPHNIIIDGGSEKGDMYDKTLKERIVEIVNNEQIIDLWIITHIDDDHIGGILRLLKDTELLEAIDLSRTTFWFNYSIWDYDSGLRNNNLKNVKQGITLRNYLLENSKIIDKITNENGIIDLWGAKALILSPDSKSYNALLKVWENEEIKLRQSEVSSKKKTRKNDYDIKIENFDITKEMKDDSEENGSSIAFILEYNGEAILFSADSHPWVLASSIATISNGSKLKLKYMQIPHHGSRYNTSNALLQLIDCQDYIISADGYNRSNLPNKETFVKVLKANSGKAVNFYITQENDLTQSIFKVDQHDEINLIFPEQGSNHLHFKLG